MDYMVVSWAERQRMAAQFREIDDVRNRAVSGAELTNRTMDAALHGAPVEALELERATAEGMPEPLTYGDSVHRQGPGRPARSVKIPERMIEYLSPPISGEGR